MTATPDEMEMWAGRHPDSDYPPVAYLGGRPVSEPCGTKSAYRRHQRHGEIPCALCRRALAVWQREYRARKKPTAR